MATTATMTMTNPHVVFIHLDLGIGGAESLVLNLAKATLLSGRGANTNSRRDDESKESVAVEDESSPSGSISIYTTHCSPTHCYDEVKPPNGPLYPYVHVRGSWIPRKLVVGGTALCSALRMLYLTYKAMRENPQTNVFVIDVLPTGVPYLVDYCNVNAGVLFYCHFPDKLLTRDTVNGETDVDENKSTTVLMKLKRMYRWVLDTTEEWTMSHSDLIVVNSKFTRGEVEKVFPSLFSSSGHVENTTESDMISEGRGHGDRVKVLYPAIESSLSKHRTSINHKTNEGDNDKNVHTKESKTPGPIVSLNRFERKKNVALLLHAYDLLLERASRGDTAANLPPLIIAGGYDPINVENVEHLSELRILANEILSRYGLSPSTVCSPSKSSAEIKDTTEGNPNHHNDQLKNASITFHPSISNAKRTQLLSRASVWCYTPHREHFGIVPLEAMDAGVPVVAIRSGGPMETILDGETGYLVDYSGFETSNKNDSTATTTSRENATVKGFADAIHKLLADPVQARVMGQHGQERVDQIFGMGTFRKQWWGLLREAHERGFKRHRKGCTSYPSLGLSVIRSVWELAWVIIFAIFFTWVLRQVGLRG